MIVFGMMTFAVLTSLSTTAQAEEPSRWTVKTGIILVDASTPFSIDKPSGGQVYAGGNAEIGVSIAMEYRLSDLIGLELGAAYAKSPDIDDSTNENNDELGEGPSFLPLTFGANFYLMESEQFEVYVGPRVAFVQFGDFDLDIDGVSTAFDVDDEFAWGATAGMNYRFGDSRWSFVAEATYLDVDMTITEQGTAEVTTSEFDPLMFNLGVSYRF